MWAHPQPTGNTWNGVQFSSENIAYAVTRGGLVLKSGDSGRNWIQLYSALDIAMQHSANLWGLHCVNDNNVWVVGFRGMVGCTDDGGETWSDRSISTSKDVRDAHFFDTNNGIVVGDRALMYSTTDGGFTWTEVTLPFIDEDDLDVVVFPNSNVGWAAGEDGRLLKTTDGGATWTIQNNLSGQPYSGCAVGNNGVAFALQAAAGGVFVVRDGGPTSGAGLGTWATGVHFTSDQVGYAVYRDNQTFYAAKTTNGGSLWTSTVIPDPKVPLHIAMSNGKGVVVGEDGTYYWTIDDGMTWNAGSKGHNVLETNGVVSVAFGDAMNGIAVGRGAGIFLTTDGGLNWQYQPVTETDNLWCVTMTSATTAYAVGEDGLALKTTDGGLSWTQMAVDSDTNRMRGISFWDANNGIIAGGGYNADDLVQKTTDGGTTWNVVSLGAAADAPFDVWTAGTQHAWLGTRDGDVIRTTDGGATWQQDNTGMPWPVQLVMFHDTNVGWVSDLRDVALTTDGGATYTLAARPPVGIRDIHFATAMIGMAAAGNTILRTTDGGANWEITNPGIDSHHFSSGIFMNNITDAVAVGAETIMLYTRSSGLVP